MHTPLQIIYTFKITIRGIAGGAFRGRPYLSIKLLIIDNNSCSMHCDYHDFYAVHVYLRSIRISLQQTQIPARILSKELELSLVKVFSISVSSVDRRQENLI